jgi:transposase
MQPGNWALLTGSGCFSLVPEGRYDVRLATIGRLLLGSRETVIEGVGIEDGAVVLDVRPAARAKGRCGICARRAPGYDGGAGIRRWRALDLARTPLYLRAPAPRVRCSAHGIVVARVPWARHGSAFTRGLEDTVAWLAAEMSMSAVAELMRLSWRTVGHVMHRVVGERVERGPDPLEGLRRIGIDELSYRRGRRYVVGVVDHDSGLLVWLGEGRDARTVDRFFQRLGPARAKLITHVTSDMGPWIHKSVARHAPQAIVCIDPFHVVRLGIEAMDEVRRAVWNEARRQGDQRRARWLKGARFAVWMNPERLSERQRGQLEQIERTNAPLYRAYLLKEQLRLVVHERDPELAGELLAAWCQAAFEAGLEPFRRAAITVAQFAERIVEAIRHRLTNARVEAINTTLRLMCRRAYGFHSWAPLKALAMLRLGGLRPPLPRTA